MDPREQLLQSLLDELRGFQLPERYDQAKKDKILSGRKAQADIDKGRDEIRQNEELYQRAVEQRRELQGKIATLQTEVETAKQRGVDTAGTQAANERKAAYDEEAGSARGIATQIGATAGAPVAGIAAGRAAGLGINALMDASQERKNATLAAAAQNRVAGLTTREGARLGTERAGVMPASTTAGRVAGRIAPHVVLGASVAGKGALLMNQGKEDDPFYSDMANRGLGLGMIGAGSGIAERGVAYAVAPGVPPDANAISVINSNQLRRNNLAETPEAPPPPSGPNPGTVPALRAEAKAAGIKGGYKMNKAQLNAALASIKQISNKVPVLAAPLAAGAVAASMTPSRGEAADGSGGGQDAGEVATNAAGAGAAAAGTGYGLNRLAQAVPPVARNALGAAGAMLGPMMAADAYDPDAERLAMDRNQAARTFPAFMRGGAVEDAYQMAQVPERNPLAAAGEPEPSYPLSGPLMKASRLELPQNVPADATQQANIASAFDPATRGRPQNALSAAGQQKDPFGQALDEFMAFVQQEMAEQQGEQPSAPVNGNFQQAPALVGAMR